MRACSPSSSLFQSCFLSSTLNLSQTSKKNWFALQKEEMGCERLFLAFPVPTNGFYLDHISWGRRGRRHRRTERHNSLDHVRMRTRLHAFGITSFVWHFILWSAIFGFGSLWRQVSEPFEFQTKHYSRATSLKSAIATFDPNDLPRSAATNQSYVCVVIFNLPQSSHRWTPYFLQAPKSAPVRRRACTRRA